MTKKTIKITSNLLFLCVFILLVWQFASPQQAIDTLKRIPPGFLVGGFLFLILTYGLRAHRFYQLLAGQQVPWFTVLRVMLQHNAINNVLPFRLGELSFPILLKKNAGIAYQHSTKVLITARLFDFAIMGSITLAIASLLFYQLSPVFVIAELTIIVFCVLFTALLLRFNRLPFYQHIHSYLSYLKQNLVTVGTISILIWLLKLTGQALWLTPMLQTRWLFSLLAVLIIEGTAILPVNGPLNFGSLEGAAMAALTPFGLEPGAVLAAVLNLHIAIIMLAALGYVVSLVLPNAPEKEAQP